MIGIVGDVHLTPPPDNRIDDYFEVGLQKIEEIANFCNHVVFLGDIFSTAKISENHLILFSRKLEELKVKGTSFYTIIGNHDVVHEDERNIDNASLGVLSEYNTIKLILPDKPVTIKDEGKEYTFHTTYVNLKRAKKHLSLRKGRYGENDILLIHHEYDMPHDSITLDDLKDLGCRHVFFGHDHKPLPEGRIIYPELTVYRCGSIMRNLATDYNLERQIYYYILGKDLHCKCVAMKPAKEVFKESSYTRQNFHKTKFVETLNNIIEKYHPSK